MGACRICYFRGLSNSPGNFFSHFSLFCHTQYVGFNLPFMSQGSLCHSLPHSRYHSIQTRDSLSLFLSLSVSPLRVSCKHPDTSHICKSFTACLLRAGAPFYHPKSEHLTWALIQTPCSHPCDTPWLSPRCPLHSCPSLSVVIPSSSFYFITRTFLKSQARHWEGIF